MVKGSGALVVLSFVLPAAGNDEGINGKGQKINTWLLPNLLATDGLHLSQRGKRIFTQELAGPIERALN